MTQTTHVEITLRVSTQTEITRSPWWLIVDPRQNFRTGAEGVSNIAHMVSGPFFSREEAEDYLRSRHYHFSKSARVYCHTGFRSVQYDKALEAAYDEARKAGKA